MNIQYVIRLLKIANNDIPSVENRLQELERKEDDLKYKNERAARTAQEISDYVSRERQTLEQFRIFVKQQQQEVERLYSEKKGLEDIIERFQNNDETYTIIKERVKEQIENALTSARQLLKLALASIIESSRKNPSMFQALRYNIPSARVIVRRVSSLSSDSQRRPKSIPNENNVDPCEKLLLEQAVLIYNQILEEFAATSISKIANDTKLPSLLQSFEELSGLQYNPQGNERNSTNALVLEFDSCSIKAFCNNNSSQINSDNNKTIVTE